jgi:hypothetical protein
MHNFSPMLSYSTMFPYSLSQVSLCSLLFCTSFVLCIFDASLVHCPMCWKFIVVNLEFGRKLGRNKLQASGGNKFFPLFLLNFFY